MKAQCIVFPRPLEATIGRVEVRDPQAGELLTRTRITGVSTGTETRVYSGNQVGSTFPLIPGYENIGEVIAAGSDTQVPVGQRMFVRTHLYDPAPYSRCWGSQVSHSLTNEKGLVLIPDAVPDEDAIYAKVAAISLHGVKRARVQADDWVVVVGLGIIGHLVVQHAVARGARVIAVDMARDRLELADQAGASATIDAGASDAVEQAHEITGGGANVAFDATGIASVLQKTAGYLREPAWDDDAERPGRLVLQGSPEDPISLDYDDLFRRETNLIIPRDCTTLDLVDSLSLMASGDLKPGIIASSRFSFRECANVYPRLVNRDLMRVLFDWDQS